MSSNPPPTNSQKAQLQNLFGVPSNAQVAQQQNSAQKTAVFPQPQMTNAQFAQMMGSQPSSAPVPSSMPVSPPPPFPGYSQNPFSNQAPVGMFGQVPQQQRAQQMYAPPQQIFGLPPQAMGYGGSLFGSGPYSFPDNQIFNDDEPLLPPAAKNMAKETAPYDLEKNLKLLVKAKQSVIKLSSGKAQMLPVMVNLKTEELTSQQLDNREPIDLICVVDVSGSMSGEKVELLKKTMLELEQFLSERDRLCIIEFNSNATRLTPLLRSTRINWKLFSEKISKLYASGGNTIPGGMDLAFKIIRERKVANPITSIFLLTDGIEPGAENFVMQRITFRKMQDVNFTINTFGFGRDHDEKLLTAICKYKDGEFYFIDKLDTISECFASSLGGLMSIVAKDVDIKVRNVSSGVLAGVTVGKTFSDAWGKVNDREYNIKLAYLLSGSERGFVMELIVPQINYKVDDKGRNVIVLEVLLETKDSTGTKLLKAKAELVLHLINENEQIGDIEEDGEVMENYFRVKGAEAIEEAIQLANRGDYQQGSAKIDYVMTQIQQARNVDQKRMAPLVQQLAVSKQGCQPQQFSAYGGKVMSQNVQNCFKQQVDLSNMQCANMAINQMVTQARSNQTQKH